jgi:hypothetical protein
VLEHLIVRDGELLVGPDGGHLHLRPGDFISFAANCPHAYESLHGEIRAILVVFLPRTRTRPALTLRSVAVGAEIVFTAGVPVKSALERVGAAVNLYGQAHR